jgi:hypothetical protein
MTRAAAARSIIGFAGGLVALSCWLIINNPLLAVLSAVVVFLSSSVAAERAFRSTASADEIRADLEERVRNPPN